METHHITISMFKTDQQEYAKITDTIGINANNIHGCSQCVGKRKELLQPTRLHFHRPRSIPHRLELGGLKEKFETTPCANFADWKTDKGCGYKHTDLDYIHNDNIMWDPHYMITMDPYHGAKNLFQQLFPTLLYHEPSLRTHRQQLFQTMCDICKLNHVTAPLTRENWVTSTSTRTYVKDISLEIAPWALVTFVSLLVILWICM